MYSLTKLLGLTYAQSSGGDWLQRRLHDGRILQVVTACLDDVQQPQEIDEQIIAVIWNRARNERLEEIYGLTLETLAAELHARGFADFI